MRAAEVATAWKNKQERKLRRQLQPRVYPDLATSTVRVGDGLNILGGDAAELSDTANTQSWQI